MKYPTFLKIKNNILLILLNIISVTFFIIFSAYLVSNWKTIPDSLPAHFDFFGNVTRWGNKIELLILYFLSLFIWIVMTGLGLIVTLVGKYIYIDDKRYSEKIIKKSNKNMQLLLSVLSTEIIIIFFFICWTSIQISLGRADAMHSWALILITCILFITAIYFTFRGRTIKARGKAL